MKCIADCLSTRDADPRACHPDRGSRTITAQYDLIIKCFFNDVREASVAWNPSLNTGTQMKTARVIETLAMSRQASAGVAPNGLSNYLPSRVLQRFTKSTQRHIGPNTSKQIKLTISFANFRSSELFIDAS